MTEFFQAAAQVLQLVIGSSAATTLTLVGVILLLLTAVMAYIALGSKPDETSNSLKVALYLCLVGGIAFSAAGPSLALYNELSNAALNPFPVQSTDQIRQRLAENARVRYVVRLIPYNYNVREERQELSIDNVAKLGPVKQLYSFVGDYEELKGRTVADAIDMTGITKNFDRVTAIIFPLPRKSGDTSAFYPANARGLLQVIRLAESQIEPKDRFIKPDTFNPDELRNLRDTDLNTYPPTAFKPFYPRYCHLARTYFCTDQPSRSLLGGLYRDWHPLGFSQTDPPNAPCDIPEDQFCAFTGWDKVRHDFKDHFGARAFLIENLDVNKIAGRIMIDFTDPHNQRIPEIGLPPLAR
ncbi:hypothetical protein [Bradyrhizobium sp. USDA 4520]